MQRATEIKPSRLPGGTLELIICLDKCRERRERASTHAVIK